jgi:hypothetical protein
MGGAANRKGVVATVRSIIAQVERAGRRWKFEPEVMSVAMAAASLLRAAELLGEALDIGTKPKSAGANVLVRTSFEYWLIGVWACFGGNDAMLGIEKSRVLKERTMAQENKVPRQALDKLQHDLDVIVAAQARLLDGKEPSSLALDQVARRVVPLIVAATGEETEADAVLDAYNIVYRSHSTYDVHPPKVIGQMLRDDGKVIRVAPVEPWIDPVTVAGTMAMHLAILGRWIDHQLGTDGDEWSALVMLVKAALEKQ